MRKALVGTVAVAAIGLVGLTGCSSSDNSSSGATTSTAPSNASGMVSSAKETASALASSAINGVQQGIQNAINAAIAAAPISFSSGSTDLSAIDNATINAVAIPLKGNDTKVVVKTYARDDDSSAAQKLAQQRGDNVANALSQAGVDKSRISVEAKGNPDQGVDVDQAQITVAS